MEMMKVPDMTTGTPNGSLTARAGLNFASQILQSGAHFLVGFVVVPIVVRGLGRELYGAWVIIQQTVGYLSLSDMRPMGTLKYTLGVRQHLSDTDEKRRQIGAALLLWCLTFPIFLAMAAGAVIWAPSFIRVGSAHMVTVRWSLVIILFSVAMDRVLAIPANVLRAQNIEYKAMGLQAATVLAGGMFMAGAIYAGYGLIGVAGASLAALLLSSTIRFFVAKRFLTWFGVSRPSMPEVKRFAGLTVWTTLHALGQMLMIGGDIFIAGIVLGPDSAAIYATTQAALRMATEPLGKFLFSCSPGVYGLCGQRAWERLAIIRIELWVMCLSALAVVGSVVVILNKPFLSLWVGEGFFGGHPLNLCLVFVALGKLLYMIDSFVMGGMLELRRLSLASITSCVFGLGTGVLLSSKYGVTGMALGACIAQYAQLMYFQAYLSSQSSRFGKAFAYRVARPFAVMLGTVAVSAILRNFVDACGWTTCALLVLLFGGISACIVWLLGLSEVDRESL
ncbi:MAG: hypothetical protein FJ015_04145, partial [Chloroflexi bacterium]|nr:hypothetical protein [Chloroflexota bacterium]